MAGNIDAIEARGTQGRSTRWGCPQPERDHLLKASRCEPAGAPPLTGIGGLCACVGGAWEAGRKRRGYAGFPMTPVLARRGSLAPLKTSALVAIGWAPAGRGPERRASRERPTLRFVRILPSMVRCFPSIIPSFAPAPDTSLVG